MGSNIIKFPERRSADRPKEKPQSLPVKQNLLYDRKIIGILIISFSLFSLNYKFFGASQNPEIMNLTEGRGVASIEKAGMDRASHQLELARKLASSEVIGVPDSSLGLRPSLEDQVRHGVLASRAYVFQKDIAGGSVVSVRLQSDSDVPAYFLDPESFVAQYGTWLNRDFLSAELNGEEITEDQKISHFTIFTKSGDQFALRIERDIYQRLKSISQTQVAGNSFN